EIATLLFGGVLGAPLTFATQFYFSRKSQVVAHINDFISDLERIESLSIEYWSRDYRDDPDGQLAIAAQLRGALHASSMFLAVAEPLLAADWEEFNKMDGRLFDATTGGYFETTMQFSEPERVVTIMTCTNEGRS
ncbi:unnamed protein product, partial [Scytosiphon promiscuus]